MVSEGCCGLTKEVYMNEMLSYIVRSKNNPIVYIDKGVNLNSAPRVATNTSHVVTCTNIKLLLLLLLYKHNIIIFRYYSKDSLLTDKNSRIIPHISVYLSNW